MLCSDDYEKLIRSLEEDYIEINKIKKELEHEESVNKKYGDQFAGFSDIFFAADLTPLDEFSVNERSEMVGQCKKVVYRSIFITQSHILDGIFCKTVIAFNLLTICAKSSILDV